jgi:hypothetical protein
MDNDFTWPAFPDNYPWIDPVDRNRCPNCYQRLNAYSNGCDRCGLGQGWAQDDGPFSFSFMRCIDNMCKDGTAKTFLEASYKLIAIDVPPAEI